MSFAFIIIATTIQVAVLIATVVFMAISRVYRLPLASRHAAQRKLAAAAIHSWLRGEASARRVRRRLRRCDGAAVASVVSEFSKTIQGERWERVVVLLRDTDWFKRMRKCSRSFLWWRRLASARTFALLGLPQDSRLIARLIADSNATVRIAAAPIIRRVIDERLLYALLTQALAAETVLQNYLFDVVKVHASAVSPMLMWRLRNAESRAETCTILRFMRELATPNFLESILIWSRHRDPRVREVVASALAKYPHARSATALGRLAGDVVGSVRAQAAESLGAIGSAETASVLTPLLDDTEWWVRLKAAVALRRVGGPGLEVLRKRSVAENPRESDLARYVLGLEGNAVLEHAHFGVTM